MSSQTSGPTKAIRYRSRPRLVSSFMGHLRVLSATGQERSSDSIAWIFKKRTLHRSETSDSYAQPERAEQNDERSQIKAATAAGRRIAVSDFCRRERFPGHP